MYIQYQASARTTVRHAHWLFQKTESHGITSSLLRTALSASILIRQSYRAKMVRSTVSTHGAASVFHTNR